MMLSVVFATWRLLMALAVALKDPATRGLVVLSAAVLASGTAFYAIVEGWTVVDALYFSVTTLTTIGYGDLVPSTGGAKVFTIVYSLSGLGLMAALVTALAVNARDIAAASARRRDGGAEEQATG